MNRDITSYEDAYLADYGFEAVQVAYRARLLLERLHLHRPRTVIEIGCGHSLVYAAYHAQGGTVRRWVVVEPGRRFAEQALAQAERLPDLVVLNEFFEDAAPRLADVAGRPADLILCSGLLHEVADASGLVAAIATVMGSNTVLHANVPNAGSFHRRLARAMGQLADLRTRSARGALLQQHRVYDEAALDAELAAHGLVVQARGGYFMKPFTHAQMEPLVAPLGAAVMDGLYELGKEMPSWASEIFAEARRETR